MKPFEMETTVVFRAQGIRLIIGVLASDVGGIRLIIVLLLRVEFGACGIWDCLKQEAVFPLTIFAASAFTHLVVTVKGPGLDARFDF